MKLEYQNVGERERGRKIPNREKKGRKKRRERYTEGCVHLFLLSSSSHASIWIGGVCIVSVSLCLLGKRLREEEELALGLLQKERKIDF